MPASKQSSVFCHDSLPAASSHFRLLEITNIDDSRANEVCCRLRTFALENAPSYCAVSYTWGDSDDTTYILVDGKRMEVRQNCEYVLKQAKWYSNGRRAPTRRRYFWCDAICINQADNNEKAFQVAMMGDIYKRAERVLCCVGEHDLDSERIMSMLQSKSPFLKAAVASRRLPGRLPMFWKISYKFHMACLRYWTRGFDEGPATPQKKPGPRTNTPFRRDEAFWVKIAHKPTYIDPLVAFITRPYFTRVWVYQELCLGSDVILCCGKDRASLVPLRELLKHAEGLTNWDSFMFSSRNHTYSPSLEFAAKLVEAGVTKTYVSGWAEGWLVRHLARVSRLDCSDDRDRVYGFLSLVPWSESSTPIFVRDTFMLSVPLFRLYAHACRRRRACVFVKLPLADRNIAARLQSRQVSSWD